MKYATFIVMVIATFLVTGSVFAESHGAAATTDAFAYGAAFLMAVASGMGTFSQSRVASAALEGVARNPQAADKVGTPLILSLALMESLVIFAFVIAIMLVLNIG